MQRTSHNIAILAALCALLLAAVPAFADGAATLTLAPAQIDIGTTYNGMPLHVEGTIPAGCQAVIRFLGEPKDVHMKAKGKIFGLLWMNLDSLTFTDVPSVFLAQSSTEFGQLGAAGDSLGLDGLKASIGVHGGNEGAKSLIGDLLHMKRTEKLYRQTEGDVTLTPADGSQTFAADIALPSRLAPGTYTVEVHAVCDGKVAASARQEITAKLVGAPEFLARMAFSQGLLYGVLAVIIALLSGLAIGLVFQSKGAH
ncbi:Conserved hypothetical protein CHP02186-related, transmembrane [Desulfovibrio sp. X2]|uniref:TIGR02186 family protein n=1 Tax=Desulfovibrio sp. X2 TaxID=941449 RepID=UPI00035873C9|nr:TIGR02186 family protein [Desulfovibrio sp. X2]EPR44266.1 Conserved hypothetical protein CHP02186-related, transmembrane [Desulfovibrio sp. X2]